MHAVVAKLARIRGFEILIRHGLEISFVLLLFCLNGANIAICVVSWCFDGLKWNRHKRLINYNAHLTGIAISRLQCIFSYTHVLAVVICVLAGWITTEISFFVKRKLWICLDRRLTFIWVGIVDSLVTLTLTICILLLFIERIEPVVTNIPTCLALPLTLLLGINKLNHELFARTVLQVAAESLLLFF